MFFQGRETVWGDFEIAEMKVGTLACFAHQHRAGHAAPMFAGLLVLRHRHPLPAKIRLKAEHARSRGGCTLRSRNLTAADRFFHQEAPSGNVINTFRTGPPRRAVSYASWILSRSKRCVTRLSGRTRFFRSIS